VTTPFIPNSTRAQGKVRAARKWEAGGIAGIAVTEMRLEAHMRKRILLCAPAGEKPRIKALAAMPVPDAAEAARLVAEFLARKTATVCPTRAAVPVRNGEGFGE
jgi:hypothetical protein